MSVNNNSKSTAKVDKFNSYVSLYRLNLLATEFFHTTNHLLKHLSPMTGKQKTMIDFPAKST